MTDFSKYLGIPYCAGDSDCWSLVQLVYKNELAVELNPYEVIDPILNIKINHVKDCVNTETKRGWRIVKPPFNTFDVLLFTLGGTPYHVGIVIDRQNMLHSEHPRVGSVIEDYTKLTWSNRLQAGFRYDKSSL